MVDAYGNWTYKPNTPKWKKCDCDHLAEWIISRGYTPKTSIENLVEMIILHFDCSDNYGEYNHETGCGGYGDYFTFERCMDYVDDSGGFEEFDYFN